MNVLSALGASASKAAIADAIRASMRRHQGVVAYVAAEFGVPRENMYRIARSVGIDLTVLRSEILGVAAE